MMRACLIVFISVLCCGSHSNRSFGQTDPDHANKMAAGLKIFDSDVRILLSGRCIKCHNQDKREGGLDLSTRESLLAGGDSGNAVEVGEPNKSYLLQLVRHQEEPLMPAEGARLKDPQIELIAQWIELGVPYSKPVLGDFDSDPQAWIRRQIDPGDQDFWSFRPLQDVQVPGNTSDSWSKNEVDRFVQQALAKKGILPNPVANRRTLIRRAFFDLIGLPPSPEQVAAFVADDDIEAYDKLIDRLLESPHYGERWARHWLDVVRFAESFGFEQDYDRPYAYQYRDFVIKAFNSNMPYDQFVKWQLAGDEIAPQEPLAMMATGFIGAGVFPTQLTEKEFESARYDELDDMVSTTGTAFLGLTIGCARCHDHKFDPIPMRDYYQMVAVFGNTIRSNVAIELDPKLTQKKLADWTTLRQQKVAELADYEQHDLPRKFQQLIDSLSDANATVDSPSSNDKRDANRNFDSNWITLHPVSTDAAQGTSLTVDDEAKIHASGANPGSESYTLVFETGLTNLRSLRLEVFPDPSLARNGPGRAGNGNFALSKISVTAQAMANSAVNDPETMTTIALTRPRATFEQNKNGLSIQASLDEDPKTGWAVDPKFGQRHAAAFDFEQPIGFAEGTRLVVKLDFAVNTQHSIGVSRLSVSQSDVPLSLEKEAEKSLEAELNAIKNAPQRAASLTIQRVLKQAFKHRDSQWQKLATRLRDHERLKPQPETVMAMICSEGVKPIPHHGDGRGFKHFYPQTHFLARGDVNQKLAIADPGFLQALTPISLIRTSAAEKTPVDPKTDSDKQNLTSETGRLNWSRWQSTRPVDASTSYRRRSLANWMVDCKSGAGNLLARVIVNRVWKHHFGRGLVATPNDFGFQGARPSHPELLDYLAQRLIEDGWRLKPLHRLIMTSTSYQQGSTSDSQRMLLDSENQFLWRFSPRRLEAEIIRDSMLFCSGQLDTTPFGPGSLNETMRRRSIYFTIKRSKLIPFLQIFDLPEPLVSVGDRPATTVAPQALICMNNAQVRKWATAFSESLQKNSDSPSEQIELGYQKALSRPPSKPELLQSLTFFDSQFQSYMQDSKKHSKAEAHKLALADVCQVLMSLNEFIFIE